METSTPPPRALSPSADRLLAKEQGFMMADEEDGGSATALLRKERRNARDRKRSQLKKDTMETMRMQVKRLEAEKQRLEQRFPLLHESPSASPVATDSDALRVAQSQYRDVLALIERLREANRAMKLEVLEKDLFRSAAQNLLDSFQSHDASAGSSLPVVLPPPMHPSDAQDFAENVMQRVRTARLESSQIQQLAAARVFGWRDFRCQSGASIKFTIQKSFPNQSARRMAGKLWQILSDATQLKRLLPPGLQCDLREVQRVSDDALVLDRVTKARAFESLGQRALRTTMMLVRGSCDDANPTDVTQPGCSIAMKTIDLPVFKSALADNEVWCDIFYWFHFEDNPVTSTTNVMIGGSLSYFSETYAQVWLAELVFLAVRWESIAVAPVLLCQNEDV